MTLRVGQVIYLATKRNYKLHVRGFVDDQVTYRYWLKHKARWEYETQPVWLVEKFMVPRRYWYG